jgi:hypothetical protein
MPVILVIIILVAWMVILGPNLLKRRSRTVGGINSISHFHRQLRVLEQSAPQPLMPPAYRLRAVDGSSVSVQGSDGSPLGVPPKLSVVGADQLPRPALAFLGEDRTGPEPAGEDTRAVPTAERGALPDVAPAPPARSGPRVPDVHVRSLARRRRRDTLGVISSVFVATGLLGFVPGAAVAWVLTLLSGLALGAYVALLVRVRKTADDRERTLRYLRPETGDGPPGSVGPSATAALPSGVAELPVRVSGRYAHPSSQAVAAR